MVNDSGPALSGTLTLDDGTTVEVPFLTADPATAGRLPVHFGALELPPGRRVAGASARSETGAEFRRRFPPDYAGRPGFEIGRGGTLTVNFEVDDMTAESWHLLSGEFGERL